MLTRHYGFKDIDSFSGSFRHPLKTLIWVSILKLGVELNFVTVWFYSQKGHLASFWQIQMSAKLLTHFLQFALWQIQFSVTPLFRWPYSRVEMNIFVLTGCNACMAKSELRICRIWRPVGWKGGSWKFRAAEGSLGAQQTTLTFDIV